MSYKSLFFSLLILLTFHTQQAHSLVIHDKNYLTSSFNDTDSTGTPLVTKKSKLLEFKAKIETLFDKLKGTIKYVESLNLGGIIELPVGIKRTIHNNLIEIGVTHVQFLPEYAVLTVFAHICILNKVNLYFGGDNIKLSYQGGIIGDGKLVLLDDVTVPFPGSSFSLVLKGGKELSGVGTNESYLSLDCNGFKDLGISADLIFPTSLIVPVDETTGMRQPYKQVTCSFSTVVSDWNDIIVTINIPKFEVTPLDGFVFESKDAILDLSDLRNSSAVHFPLNYLPYLDAGQAALWKGVFISNLTVTLPRAFRVKQDSSKRISFIAHNLLIDKNGVTGDFSATHILPIDVGTAGGWAFSVDKLFLSLLTNNITQAGFEGEVGIPISEKTRFGYKAIINPNNEYLLAVKTIDTANFSFWKARATLLPNSYIELKYVNNRFKPSACLSGSLTIDLNDPKNNKVSPLGNFKGLEFRNLKVFSDAPYLQVEYFGFKGELSFAHFPISIRDINFRTLRTEAKLGIDIGVNIMENKFSGNTKINLVSQLIEKDGYQKWDFLKMDVDKLDVTADIGPACKFKGSVEFLRDHSIYGNGFRGSLEASFLDNITVQAKAMFASNRYRYWFVDARVLLSSGIPLGGPLFKITGFGGGASYHLKSPEEGFERDALSSAYYPKYMPDEQCGLGVRASVYFNIVQKSLSSGMALLDIACNSSGGINYIALLGKAKFMAEIPFADNINKLTDFFNETNKGLHEVVAGTKTAQVLEKLVAQDPSGLANKIAPLTTDLVNGFEASVGMRYDFTQKVFHSNFDFVVNAAGGLLVGTGANYQAGHGVLHIEPNKWYLHFGDPAHRVGLKVGLKNFSVQAGMYFMMGDDIPSPPPPPQEVADILGQSLESLTCLRQSDELQLGKGFAMGANIQIHTGDLTFLILYANFKAGIGFDVLLKQYSDFVCAGRNGPPGINGWYAQGQAYSYLQGELGVRIDLPFLQAKYPIIQAGIACLLQAQLPNPSWFRGQVGVNFNLLNGLVKGNMQMKVTIGDACDLVLDNGNPLGTSIIADISPSHHAQGIDVFTAPQVVFNMPIGKEFRADNKSQSYKIVLDTFIITNKGQVVIGSTSWNEGHNQLIFSPHEILPPNSLLQLQVVVSFQEWKNNRWETIMVRGKKGQEIKTVDFETGTAPDVIPLSNIEYAYPIPNQHYLYKNETEAGIIKLKKGQSYLFDTNYMYKVQFLQGGHTIAETDLRYYTDKKEVHFTLKALDFKTAYQIVFVGIPKQTHSKQSNTDHYQNIQTQDNQSYSVRQAQAGIVIKDEEIRNLLSYNFQTSAYALFSSKIKALSNPRPLVYKLSSNTIMLETMVNTIEPFDDIEIAGSDFNKPAIQLTAILTDSFYQDQIAPLIYNPLRQYNQLVALNNRTAYPLGTPPNKALTPIPSGYTRSTNTTDAPFNTPQNSLFPWGYNLDEQYKLDFQDLQLQCVALYIAQVAPLYPNFPWSMILQGHKPFMNYGYYGVQMQYQLPDGRLRSADTIFYFNPIH
ncbi:MAG: hypothetical protein QM528_01430 [Phycisphaerales bacterium]|nr:hypothetical protein [Phycisphaerales bacterium]